MSQPLPTAYDTVSYPGYAYVQTHPDHLAASARLCGLSPAPIETCRVLEVGCGDAANLLPMSVTLPHATFHGFDLASSSIERGRAIARELGLANLTLDHLDINEAPERIGEFDYVIAHGFYSWVPQAARDKLMAICRASLSPNGIAFISYNALPGGHIRRMLREMMLFHVDRAPDPRTKTTQARALLHFLANLSAGDDPFQIFLKGEIERVQKYRDAHLYHDDLAPIFDCFYLHEFVAHAAGYDLQFVADMNSSFVHVAGLDDETTRALSELDADPILREQYLDFACCRRFRQTLLCHSSLAVDHRADPAKLVNLFVSSRAATGSEPADITSDSEVEFRGARNASLKTNHPVMKAALALLSAGWPERLSIGELRERIAQRLEIQTDTIPPDLLEKGLLSAYTLRMLDLHAHRPRLTREPGYTPRTTPLIRFQIARAAVVTNLLHESIQLEGDAARLLGALDGRRDRGELAKHLEMDVAVIDSALAQLARMALIEG